MTYHLKELGVTCDTGLRLRAVLSPACAISGKEARVRGTGLLSFWVLSSLVGEGQADAGVPFSSRGPCDSPAWASAHFLALRMELS